MSRKVHGGGGQEISLAADELDVTMTVVRPTRDRMGGDNGERRGEKCQLAFATIT